MRRMDIFVWCLSITSFHIYNTHTHTYMDWKYKMNGGVMAVAVVEVAVGKLCAVWWVFTYFFLFPLLLVRMNMMLAVDLVAFCVWLLCNRILGEIVSFAWFFCSLSLSPCLLRIICVVLHNAARSNFEDFLFAKFLLLNFLLSLLLLHWVNEWMLAVAVTLVDHTHTHPNKQTEWRCEQMWQRDFHWRVVIVVVAVVVVLVVWWYCYGKTYRIYTVLRNTRIFYLFNFFVLSFVRTFVRLLVCFCLQ